MTAPFQPAFPVPRDRAAARSGAAQGFRHRPLLALCLAGAVLAPLLAPVLAQAEADLPPRAEPPASGLASAPGSGPARAPLRCEIALDAVRGGTEITGIVTSDVRAVAGDYRLAITSRSAGGSATIRQSGAFQARPGQPAILGQTRLMGPPASQDVDLSVTVAGARLLCASSL